MMLYNTRCDSPSGLRRLRFLLPQMGKPIPRRCGAFKLRTIDLLQQRQRFRKAFALLSIVAQHAVGAGLVAQGLGQSDAALLPRDGQHLLDNGQGLLRSPHVQQQRSVIVPGDVSVHIGAPPQNLLVSGLRLVKAFLTLRDQCNLAEAVIV